MGDLIPGKPGDEDYITPDHYESFLAYFRDFIPTPVEGDVDFQDFQKYKGIINIIGPLKHVIVLKGILANLVNILNIQDSNTLYNFKLWFFKDNSVRKGLEGTKAFVNTVWYKNHIAKLENFLEDIIGQRAEYLEGIQNDSQGSTQSGKNFRKRYNMPLIDPTKFETPEIMNECQAINFLKHLLGEETDYPSIVSDYSWKSTSDEIMTREVWEVEWGKKKDNRPGNAASKAADIPDSNVTRSGGEICSAFENFKSTRSEKYKRMRMKSAIRVLFGENTVANRKNGTACVAVSQVLNKIITDADSVNSCEGFDEWQAEQARAGQATGGSQKRRKDTRRKIRKDTRRKRKDTRRKLRKDTRRKIRKDTRRKKKDTRRKTRK